MLIELARDEWNIEKITDRFETPLYQKWRSRNKASLSSRTQSKLDNLAVQLSQEREEIFNQVLGVDTKKKEFSRRAHVEQLDEKLYGKLNKVFQEKGFDFLKRHNGFFVYHPRGNRTVVVLPRKQSSQLDFFLIKGLALRAIQLNKINRLVRVHTYVPEGVFLEEKVLEKDEYDEVIKDVIEEFCASLV